MKIMRIRALQPGHCAITTQRVYPTVMKINNITALKSLGLAALTIAAVSTAVPVYADNGSADDNNAADEGDGTA